MYFHYVEKQLTQMVSISRDPGYPTQNVFAHLFKARKKNVLVLVIGRVDFDANKAKKNKVFVSGYITRKTGVGRSGKHFFCIFFILKNLFLTNCTQI